MGGKTWDTGVLVGHHPDQAEACLTKPRPDLMEERDRKQEPRKVNSGPEVPHSPQDRPSPDYSPLQSACLGTVLSPGSLTSALAGRATTAGSANRWKGSSRQHQASPDYQRPALPDDV